jgi:Domain of unknown function (DUF2804), C-terminal/Domain of unknown function (DUF2804), N-terminal
VEKRKPGKAFALLEQVERKMLKSPPERLINKSGRPNLGVYASPISGLNLDDFDFRRLRRFPFSLSEKMSKLLKKRWQYVGVFDENLVAGAAVVDLSYMGNAFAFVYLREQKRQVEMDLLDPGARKVAFAANSMEGACSLEGSAGQVRIDVDPGEMKRNLHVQAQGFSIDLEVDESGFDPIAVCARVGLHGFNYTHKAAGLPAKGKVVVNGNAIELSKNALAVLDWTTGCPPYLTHWNWASAAGKVSGGAIAGINLVSGINESAYTENAIWVDGKVEKVDIVHFDYDPDDIMTPWKIVSNDGKVDLTFHPEGERSQSQNYLVVVSRFRQPFGRYEGTLTVKGEKRKVESIYGFAEEHFVKW